MKQNRRRPLARIIPQPGQKADDVQQGLVPVAEAAGF